MTDQEKLRALVRYRLDQADEALRAARMMLADGLERSAVNRAYYAMFYAVLGLLATKAQETSRHSGAISRFDRDYVKPGILPRDFSRWLHEAFNQRQSADYAAAYEIEAEGIKELVDHAALFVGGILRHLRETGFAE